MKPSPSPAATQQNEFEKYPELARHIKHFANKATNVSLKDWWALLDALNASLIAASRGTRALTEEELLTPELIKKAADAGERVGWEDVLTPNAQIYHRAIDLKKYETALRAVLPIIISRLTGEPSA